MAELEPFEMRLQSALRRYLADAPVEVDAAGVTRRVVAETPRHRILAGIRPFGLSPALAWLLIALLLVAALVGALLVAGSQRRPLPAIVPPVVSVAACPPGSTPDEPGPVGQARPAGGDIRMAFDRESGRIVAFTPDDVGAGVAVWAFDVCTNAWARQEPAGEPGPAPDLHMHTVFDVDSGVAIAFASDGTPSAYDPRANLWLVKAPRSTPLPTSFRAVYDPMSGLVLVMRASSIQTYDVDIDVWHAVHQTGDLPPGGSEDHHLYAYDWSADRIIVVGAERRFVRRWDPRTGTWTASEARPAFNTGYVASGGEIAYDEAGRRTIVFSDGYVGAYDAAADEWEVLRTGRGGPDGLGLGPQARLGHWMVYDPVNERLVVAGGEYRTADGWVRADDVWAFDPATKEWIQLLAPSRIERYDTATEAWQPVPKDSQP